MAAVARLLLCRGLGSRLPDELARRSKRDKRIERAKRAKEKEEVSDIQAKPMMRSRHTVTYENNGYTDIQMSHISPL